MIPDEMLQSWALYSETDVSITIQAQQIIITPSAQTDEVDPNFTEQLSNFINAYRPALEALAQ